MKKFLIVLFMVLAVSSSAFAENFFSKRYVEIKTDIPVGVSNNVFALNEILVKNLVIDLRDIARRVPGEGVVFTTVANPKYSVNCNFSLVNFGVDFGLDLTERFAVSKDLFDFFGYGNEIGEELEISFINHTDVYWFFDVRYGMELSDLKFQVMPALFIPLLNSSGIAGSFSSVNDENGNLLLKFKTDMSYYSNFSFEDMTSVIDVNLIQKAGVDLAGEFAFPINEIADLRFKGRVPIVPGRLNTLSYVSMEYTIDSKVTEIAEAEVTSTDLTTISTDSTCYVNRPLKAEAFIDVTPVGSFATFSFGAGAGAYQPFTDSMVIYPEYYMGVMISMADILNAGVSTEYTDQIYKHQLSAGFNLRLFELDAGVSFQSASFTRSFAGGGMGGFITISSGF